MGEYRPSCLVGVPLGESGTPKLISEPPSSLYPLALIPHLSPGTFPYIIQQMWSLTTPCFY